MGLLVGMTAQVAPHNPQLLSPTVPFSIRRPGNQGPLPPTLNSTVLAHGVRGRTVLPLRRWREAEQLSMIKQIEGNREH